MILAPGKVITGPDIDRLLPIAPAGPTLETFKQESEKRFLAQKLRENDWNISETARALQIPRSALYKKLERYGINRESV